MSGPQTTFKPVTESNWSDFEALFEARGGPKYCWCMAWRRMDEDRASAPAKARKAALHKRVAERVPIGILAYQDGEPVGWCSVAPRDTLLKMSPDQNEDETGVWSVVCFFIPRRRRGEGLAEKLLDAAVKLAFKRGAKVVEGYPVAASSPSYRFMGFVPMFKRAGFCAAGKAGSRRHVMRKVQT
jgi:GNAT superfamily N-acetyltransferase